MSKQKKYKYIPKCKKDIDCIFDIKTAYTIKEIATLTGLGLRKLHAFCRKVGLIEYWMDHIHTETDFARDNGLTGDHITLVNKVSGFESPTITLTRNGLYYLFDELNNLDSMNEFEDILKNKQDDSNSFNLDDFDYKLDI